jgi:hypothetical protein
MSKAGDLYWHGGPSGLKEQILPPAVTGVMSTADCGARAVCRKDRVYLTSERLAAEMFASMAPAEKASVYLVSPNGPIEHDPDTDEPGLSFQVPSAKIVYEFRMSTSRRARLRAEMMR